MVAIAETCKVTCHVRSISLPARSHPLNITVEAHLDRLRSSSSICHKLCSLKDLYGSIDDLLRLRHTQQALFEELQPRESAEKMLDGSVRLLDACSTIRDIFSQMKEYLKELESSLRRRKIGESGFTTEIEAYLLSRKKLKNAICNCLKNLKNVHKNGSKDTIGVLREVEDISLTVFGSLLSLIYQPKATSRLKGWSVVSKLLQSKAVSDEGEVVNEVKKIDAEVIALKSSKNINSVQVNNLLKGLAALELSIQQAEEELECVYRQLLKTRVSFLNIFNY